MREPLRKTRRQRMAAGLRTARARFRGLDRRDRVSVFLWLAITAALAPFVIGATGRMHASEVVVPGTESAKAQELSKRAFGREYDHLILLQGPPGVLDREGPAIAERIARIPKHSVLDPWRAGGRALRPKPDQAVVVVATRKSFDAAGPDAARMRELLRHEVRPPLTVHLTGFADLNRAIKNETVTAMERCELIAAPLLVIVLLLILGSPIAAGMPLFLGGCVAVMEIGTVDLINRYVTNLEVTSIAVGLAMSLALGVDYALLLVARFRRELAAGTDVREASEVAAARAGRTVRFAGLVLAFVMTAATIATPASVLKSATVGVLVAVAFSLLGATFALPPMLRWAGRDINRYQIVSPGAESRRWSGVALAVLRRPALAAVLVLGLMLALSAPALGLQTGPPDPRVLPKDDPARADFDAIEHDLGATRAMPYVVTVVANHGTLADERLQELARFERELARDPDTAEVLGPATVARRVAALATAPEKLQEASAAASDGQRAAAKLNNGLAQASGGAGDVVGGLRAAANGSAKLRAGGARAEGAAGQIHNGVELARNGAAALRGGLARAVAGARELESGGNQASDGAHAIARNLAIIERKTHEALPGAAQLASGLEQGARDLRRLKEPAELANSQAADALKGLDDMLPTSKADPAYRRTYKSVATIAGALSGRNPVTGEPVRDGYPGLPAALDQAASQASQAAAGARRLRGGLDSLSGGLGQLADGARRLSGGVDRVSAGNRTLAGGAERLLAGAGRLEDGLGRLSGGTGQLLDGIGRLRAGSDRLASALNSGAGRAQPLVSGLDRLHGGAEKFGSRTHALASRLDDSRRLAKIFKSGYATVAAIATAPRSQRDAAAWAINWDQGGDAVRFLVAQKASYKEGASPKDSPYRGGNPYRARLEERVDRLAKRIDATAGVGGNQAGLADFDQAARDSLPRLVIVLVLATYLALVAVLRNLILPFIAVLLNVLTMLAAFGVMALAFGPNPLLGGPGFVDDIMVMVVYTVTFALSIDYAVFLLDRMREGWTQTGTVERAIAYGIEGTAGVITGAAAIMASVFIGFLLSPVVSLRELGLALTVAVIVDATLIRLVLLPAALRLAGERAWHTPRWLEWLSRPRRPRASGSSLPTSRGRSTARARA